MCIYTCYQHFLGTLQSPTSSRMFTNTRTHYPLHLLIHIYCLSPTSSLSLFLSIRSRIVIVVYQLLYMILMHSPKQQSERHVVSEALQRRRALHPYRVHLLTQRDVLAETGVPLLQDVHDVGLAQKGDDFVVVGDRNLGHGRRRGLLRSGRRHWSLVQQRARVRRFCR